MNKKTNFVFPKELEKYRPLLANTGGNDIENLMTRYYNDDSIMKTNIAVALLGASVEAQITLLHRLIEDGLIKKGA